MKDWEEAANKRYHSCVERSKILNIPSPKLNDYYKLFILSKKNGFKCFYCKKSIKIKQEYPYPDVPSVDHKTPLTSGGTNMYENLVLCCHQCNIIKGTLKSDSYFKLLGCLKKHPELMDEMFRGMLANKIERARNETS